MTLNPTDALPLVDREVTLSVDDARLAARVDGTGNGFTDIALLGSPATRPHGPTTLEFVSAAGVCRLAGDVDLLDRHQPAGSGDVMRFSHRGGVQLVQRREFIRTDVVLPVVVRSADRAGVSMRCRTLNVSAGGLLMEGLAGVHVGDLLEFSLELTASEPPVEGTCRVVREAADRHGVQFADVRDAARDRLVAFAFQRARVG